MLIRHCKKEDLPKVLDLIKELAIYEKEPLAVKTTLSDLERDGFSDQPFFHALVAEADNNIEGFALYFFTWSTWEGRPTLYLEDLFVRETSRKQGLGYKLFQELSKIAVEKKCSRFEWAVLDWNTPARDFYHKLGAHHKKGWLPYRLEGEALKNLASNSNLS